MRFNPNETNTKLNCTVKQQDLPFWAEVLGISEWQLRNVIFIVGPRLKDILKVLDQPFDNKNGKC